MKLSVIIVSYQVRHYLAQCLDSLQRALKDLESEVIVVDNHSSDDTVAYIRKNYSWVRVIASNHNLGFAKANNIALRLAKGEDHQKHLGQQNQSDLEACALAEAIAQLYGVYHTGNQRAREGE